MIKSTRYIVLFSIVAIVVALVAWYKLTPGKYDQLATCLKNDGVKFYGAYWCPHCKATKGEFGKSARKLPYIECANPDQSQTQICIDAKIVSYPTWEFPQPIILPAGDNDTTISCDAKLPEGQSSPKACEDARPGTWITVIDKIPYASLSKPGLANKVWTLPALTRASGELPIELIGRLASCPLTAVDTAAK